MTSLTELIQKSQTKHHLIFDFDNTLFYLHLPWPIWHDGIAVISKKHNLTVETHTSAWSINLNNAVLQNPALLPELVKFQASFESENLEGYDTHVELVEWIKHNQQFTYSIWSAQSCQTINSIIEKHGISKSFASIYCRDNLTQLKPHREGFNRINENNLPHTDFLMVGDSSTDKNAALSAGIEYCYLSVQNQ